MENENAMPGVYNSLSNEFKPDGLSKLEYAAIHIATGLCADGWANSEFLVGKSIKIARKILKQIEDDSTPTAPDTEP